MTFNIPAFQEPTKEALEASSAEWLARVGPTLIDRWPKDLLDLSFKTEFIDLPNNFVESLFREPFLGFDGQPDHIVSSVAYEFDKRAGWNYRFFRLNSRSSKDCLWPLEAPITCSGKVALGLMAGSERILDDLCYFNHSTANPKLCLREVAHGLRPDREYRVFIKDRNVLAVAEYFSKWQADKGGLPVIKEAQDVEIREKIDVYLRDTLIPRLHIDTVVADLWFQYGSAFPILIEINPFGSSDPVGAGSYQEIEKGIPGIARHPRS